MKDLSRLIHAVTEEESESVIRYYSLNNNGASKRLKLFNMVRWKDINDDRMAAKKLYNSGPGAAFSQLKKRLKEDILNILLSREACPGKSPKNFVDAEALALKYVLYGKMLLNRGLTEEAVDVLKKAFKLARDHEAFEVQALAHSVFKTYSLNHLSSELADAEEDFASHVDDFYQLMRLNLNLAAQKNSHRPQIATNGHASASGKKSRKHHASIRLQLVTFSNELEKHLQAKDYGNTQDIAQALLLQVQENGHLLSSSQKASIYLNIARAHIGLEQLKEAISYSLQSSALYKPFEEKKLESFLTTFKSYFYGGQLAQAGQELKNCESMEKSLGREKSELPLFKAYLLFRERNFKASVKLLNVFFRRSKPRMDVVMNGRLLELQNLIEMEDYDWFDYKLDSFRKVVKYHASEPYSERFVLIYKLFAELKRLGYNRDALLENGKNEWLQQLSCKKSPCSWDPLGTELVPVHRWVTDKGQ